jgi:uncharacterized oligopeptide transporter (OPT) family protein
MLNKYLAPTLTRLGVLTSHSAAFVILLGYVAAWLVLIPEALTGNSSPPSALG